MTIPSFNSYIEKSILDYWDQDALTDYKGATLQYHDVARIIEKLHIVFEHGGVKKGDKIAICGRNSSHWAVAFFATLTYGAVVVPILHEFTPDQVHNIVNHSGAKILFVGDVVGPTISQKEIPNVEAIVYLPDFSLMFSKSEKITYAREHLNLLYGEKYPKFFRKEHVHYHVDSPDELAIINYTSGTTGFSKGVMIPYRAIWGNLDFCLTQLSKHVKPKTNHVCILPLAHMYGLSIELIYMFCYGMHNFFLTRLPSPSLIAEAFRETKPTLIVAVPLIIEKIIRKRVFPKIQNNLMRILFAMPGVNKKVKERICSEVSQAFGGNFFEIIVGGAALNQEIEQFLKDIDFPITVGYGATECAPLISYSHCMDFIPKSCGTPVSHMEVKILSEDPAHIAGEIVTRGINVMLGYFQNDQATREVIDSEGWYHTGDLGTMDEAGHIFIRGRIKNMLLGPSGQNIYPEEIEDKLSSMMMVSECIVIQEDNQLIGLVYPDMDEAKAMNFTQEDLENIMSQHCDELNKTLPAFSKLTSIRLMEQEFEKTPKRSIKRHLYQKH